MSDEAASQVRPQLSQVEFIALSAMLFATVAFSIDAMLPAFPGIAAELSPEDPNRAQLIITSFVLGMGIGTLFTGPLSDALGRKPVILGGAALYCAAAAWAWAAGSLEMVLLARVVQGIGAGGPRVVMLAIVRDLYAGRRMAKIMSFAMLIFTLVPAVAPLVGSWVIAAASWRAIFGAFILFSAVSMLWLGLRQPETLPPSKRRPFRAGALMAAFLEVVTNRRVLQSTFVLTLAFGMLFANLAATQQVFDVTYGRGDSFPMWFAGIALVSGTGSLLNARVVERVGMRRVVTLTFLGEALFSLLVCALMAWGRLPGDMNFALYLSWSTSVFFIAGLTIGNLNALAMEPMGHIAGMAASIVGSIATVAAVVIAVPIGLAFDGTPVPLILGVALCGLVGLAAMTRMRDMIGV